LLLAIAGFSLSLLGAFIIRSGVMTSVHAFAVDPQRGMYILSFLGLVVGSSLTLYAVRAGGTRADISFSFLSREFFMLINNVVLVVALAVVLWGTLAPIGYEAITSDRISIGPPFFDLFFVPLMLLLGLALGLVPLLNWKRTRWEALRDVVRFALPLAFVIAALVWFVTEPKVAYVLVAIAFAVWILITHGLDIWRRVRGVARIPLAYTGMTIAHLGFAMSIVGVAITATQSVEEDLRMVPQQVAQLGETQVRFLGVREVKGPNYVAQQGIFVLSEEADGSGSFELRPEKRRYLAGGNIMTEAAIDAGFWGDTYVSLGEALDNGAWAVRLHKKPLVRWIWLGALLMALGGVVAVFDRRYAKLSARDQRQALEDVAITSAAR